VLLGFDAPLGVPTSFWHAAVGKGTPKGPQHFAEWLEEVAKERGFFQPAESPARWSLARPFFKVAAGRGALGQFEAVMRRQGIASRRSVEEASGGKSVFIVSGIPGSVGSSSVDIWRGLGTLRPASRVRMWPFDGPLQPVPADKRVTVAEIYPRLAYCVALDGSLSGKKGSEATRRDAIARLQSAEWVRSFGVSILDTECAIASDDAFDALVTAAALLRCVLEGRSLSDPGNDDPVAEGGILLSHRAT
jgi:hypothetical protein